MAHRLSEWLRENLIKAEIPESDWIYVDNKDENCITTPHQMIKSSIMKDIFNNEMRPEEVSGFFTAIAVYIFGGDGEIPDFKDRYMRKTFEEQLEFLRHNNEKYFQKTIKDRIRKRKERGSIKATDISDSEQASGMNALDELHSILKPLGISDKDISSCQAMMKDYKYTVDEICEAINELHKRYEYNNIHGTLIMTKVAEMKSKE